MSEETISHALSETYDLGESAKAISDDEGADTVEEKAEEHLAEIQDKAEDREDLVGMLVDMTGLSSDEINQALDEMLTDEKEMHGDEEMNEDEDEMEEEAETEEKAEESDEADEVETEEKAGPEDVMPHAEAIAEMVDGMSAEDVMEALGMMEQEGDYSDDEEEDMESEAKADEPDADEEVQTEEKAMTEEEVESMVDEKLSEAVDEISDQVASMETEVADSVAERVSEKMKTGSTPESDANPADDGTRNLLDEW